MNKKAPAHNKEAEEALLSALMIDNLGIDDIAMMLKPSDFDEKSHEKIFQAIIDLHTIGKGVDLVTVATRLREKGQIESIGGAAFLSTIADAAPMAMNTKGLCRYYKRFLNKPSGFADSLKNSTYGSFW